MIRAVIFDFDGTLVDFVESDTASLEDLRQLASPEISQVLFAEKAVSRMIEFHDLKVSGLVDPLTLHSYRLSNTFSDLGIPWDKKYIRIYRELLLGRTKPYKGVVSMLSRLKGRVKLGLLTNAYDPAMQRRRIRAAGLFDFFNSIVITGEELFSKPDPGSFHLAAGRLGVKPHECIYVGDSPKYDVQGAVESGMISVLLRSSTDHVSFKPDHHVQSIQELERLLQNLISWKSS